MTILRKGLLGLIVAAAVLTVVGPVIAISLLLATLMGTFALAVCLWAFVLLGERWIDEGLGSYNYLDALSDALDDVAHGLVTAILSLRPSSIGKRLGKLRTRIVAALPLLGERFGIVWRLIVIAGAYPALVVIQGVQSVRRDFAGLGRGIKARWGGAYLV